MRAFVPRPVQREWWVLAMNGVSSPLTGHGKHATVSWAMRHSTLIVLQREHGNGGKEECTKSSFHSTTQTKAFTEKYSTPPRPA